MINLKKTDPVADVIRGIMEKELIGNQKKLDKNHNGHLDKQDFEILRGQKKKVKEEEERTEDNLHGRMKTKKKDDVGPGSNFKSTKTGLKSEDVESVDENAFDWKKKPEPKPSGDSGVKLGSRYGGGKQKDKPEHEEPKEKKEETSYFKQRLLEKNWIAGAIKHPGAMTRAAKKAGESTSEYEQKHKHDSGVAGKRARLAITLKGLKKEETEQVDEGMKDALKKMGQKTFKTLTGGSDEDQRKDLQRKMGVPQTGKKPTQKEEVEIVYEANIQPTSAKSRSHISNLSNPIVNGVTHQGKQIGLITKQPNGQYHAHHSAAKLAHAQSGTFDNKDKAHQFIRNAHADAIKKGTLSDKFSKANEEVDQVQEVAPPGFEGTVKAMKKHKDITNPFALAWSMKNKGYKSHKKADGSDK